MNLRVLSISAFVLPLAYAPRAFAYDASFAPSGPAEEVEEPEPAPQAPPTPRARRFGDAGTFAVTSFTSLSFGSESFHDSSVRRSTFGVDLEGDYFAFPHISIGAFIAASSSSNHEYDATGQPVVSTSTSYGVGLRIGVDIPLGDYASWWTRVGFDGGSLHGRVADQSDDESFVNVQALSYLLVHPVPHFFFGFGPELATDVVRSTPDDGDHRRTFLGANLVVGGWW